MAQNQQTWTPVKRITLRDLLDNPEHFKAELGQPFVNMLLNHKSNWQPDSCGGEPNCRPEPVTGKGK